MLNYDELFLSDGTTTIDLLSLTSRTGVHLLSWRAGASRYKDRGYWHNPAIASGRRPAMHLWDAVEERMVFGVVGWTPDDLARQAAVVRNLLQRAWDYFEANIPQSAPIYLVRRVQGETNREYSLVLGGFADEDVEYLSTRSEYGVVSFDGWEVTVWREEHWRDTIPGGDPTCILNSGYGEYTQYIEFDRDGPTFAAPTYIQVPAGVGLDDLTGATITAEAWVRIVPDLGAPAIRGIMCKCNNLAAQGWSFFWDAANGVSVIITCAGADAITRGGLGVGCDINDGNAHHVAFCYVDAADNFPHLWIDGVEQTNVTQAKGGAPDADAAFPLYIGRVLGQGDWQGDIGWTRVSNAEMYAAPFTPPPRCYLPDTTLATTLGQWIGGEVNGTIIDSQEGTAARDGTLYNGIHDCDCRRGTVDANLDPEYFCDPDDITVFIRNAHVRAQPTHMYALDQPAAWGADLITQSAFNILPPNSVAGDGFYAGITIEATLFYGPFFNLVFDIASTSTYTGTWQYYSTAAGPAWANLDVHDGTDGLENTGVVAVTWEIDTDDWEPLAINGFTGYWVRFHLTAGAVASPIQQNRPVYTTTWAFTEIGGTDAQDPTRPTLVNSVPGDVPALAKIQCIIAGEENDTASAGMTGHAIDRLTFGMRSLSRGPDFCAYLNAGDPSVIGAVGAQEPIGVEPWAGYATGVPTVDDTRDQGLHVLCNGAGGVWQASQNWYILPEYAWQYYGRFRLFARAQCTALVGVSEIRARIIMTTEDYLTREYTFIDTNLEKLVDLGLITFPGIEPITSADTPSYSLTLRIETSFTDAGTDRIKLYGVILLPADEKVVETTLVTGRYGAMNVLSTRILMDSTSTLRTTIRSLTTKADGSIMGYMLPISAGAVTFQANADQRIWMVGERYAGGYWSNPHEFHAKMLLHRVAQYRSTRGNR